MQTQLKKLYEFGEFQFDPAERYLIHRGHLVSLTPKASETLFALVQRSGHVVTRDELLKEVWQDAVVEEATVAQNVFILRKVLRSYAGSDLFIETVPKLGYRFVAPVRITSDEGSSLLIQAHTRTHIVTQEEVDQDHFSPAHQGLERQAEAGISNAASGNLRVEDGNPDPLTILSKASTAWPRRNGPFLKAILVMLFLIAGGAGTVWIVTTYISRQLTSTGTSPFERMRLSKITLTGRATAAAVSFDGKQVAYVLEDESGRQSLRVRQTDTANDVHLVSQSESRFEGLTFSPDRNYVFYVAYEKFQQAGVLYQIPTIGGFPKRVLDDVDSPISFSPDQKEFAFVRGFPASREWALMIANADGTGERKLFTRAFPAFSSLRSPAWSPDGKIIACAMIGDDGQGIYASVIGINVENGTETRIGSQRWVEIGYVGWLREGRALVVSATGQLFGSHQIWQLDYHTSETRRITNDLNDYRGVSLATEADTLTTIQTETLSSIWISPGLELDRVKQIPESRNEGLDGIAWTPEGKVVFTSEVSGQSDLWIMDADGSNKRPLTDDDRRDFSPTVTPDGRYVVYVAASDGGPGNLWRIALDGSGRKQLTAGSDDRFPNCSSDGKWVLYASYRRDPNGEAKVLLRKVSIDAGESVPLTEHGSFAPLVSHDGKLLAYFNEAAPSVWKLVVIPLEGGKIIYEKEIAWPGDSPYRWIPDGSALTYVKNSNRISNVWGQPLDAKPPRQLTNFTSQRIFRFAWSPDGKHFACVRGTLTSNVVMIRDFR